MWFPRSRRSIFQRVVAALGQYWVQSRRERRLAQVRQRRTRRSFDHRGQLVHVIERLEPRTLLSAISWDGGAGNLNWNSALNWSGDVLPTVVDDVSINTAGITVTLVGAASVHSLQSNANLTVSSGALTVGASSAVNGNLSLTSSSVTVDGASAQLFANGTTTVNSSNLFALNGGQLSLLGPASHNAFSVATTIRASGAGSNINLSGMTSFNGSLSSTGAGTNYTSIQSLAGGHVQFGNTQTLTGQTSISADGVGSLVDLSGVLTLDGGTGTTFNRMDPFKVTVQNSGTIQTPNLQSLKSVALYAFNGLTLDLHTVTSYTGVGADGLGRFVTIQASGAGSRVDLTGVTSFVGSFEASTALGTHYVSLQAVAGGTVDLSSVATLTGQTNISADGAGSTVNLAAAQTLDGGVGTRFDRSDPFKVTVRNNGTIQTPNLQTLKSVSLFAFNGLTLDLHLVTTYTALGADGLGRHVTIQANGAGSRVDLSGLTSFRGSYEASTALGTHYVLMQAIAGGVVDLSGVATLTGQNNISADGAGSIVNLTAAQTLDGGTGTRFDRADPLGLTVRNGGAIQTPNVQTLKSVSLYSFNGLTLDLHSATSYTGVGADGLGRVVTIQASGAGSLVDLTGVTSFVGSFEASTALGTHYAFVKALAGGTVNLSAVPTLTGQNNISADGAGSVVNLTAAQTLDGGTGTRFDRADPFGLTVRNGGAIQTPNVQTLRSVSLYAFNGLTLDLHTATSYTGVGANGLGRFVTIQANGAGSLVDLTGVTSFVGSFEASTALGTHYAFVKALAGGTVNLSAVPTLTGQTSISADGAGSIVNLTAAQTLDGGTGTRFDRADPFGLTVRNGGAIQTPNVLTLKSVSLYAFNGLTLDVHTATSYTGVGADGVGRYVTIQANGAGSRIDLSGVTSFAGSRDASTSLGTHYVNVQAVSGGVVDLTGAVTISQRTAMLVTGGQIALATGVVDFTGTSIITVSSGSLTAGTLRVATGADVTVVGTLTANVENRGLLRPGNSLGTLGIVGNFTQTTTGTLFIQLGGTTPGTQYDRVVVTGAAAVAGTLNVSFVSGFVPAVGNTFLLIDNDAVDAVSGTFAGLAEGATIIVGGQTLRSSYIGGDGNDFVLNDYLSLTVTNTADSGAGSLREAIIRANANAGPDLIDFNIPGAGTHTIQPLSALPTITGVTIIDATTQPGYAGSPLIELNGNLAGSADGLKISAGSSTVRGLVINRFSGSGIELRTNGGNIIEANYIGVDVTGTIDLGNSNNGILVNNVGNNTIGGTLPGTGNVISGNNGAGIELFNTGASGNLIRGNRIGTDVSGTLDVGNSLDGVAIVAGSNNIVGGTTSAARNIISGNNSDGIHFISGGSGNQILGNYIGTNAAGNADLGNANSGLRVDGVSGNIIGGAVAGSGNVISGNDNQGIWLRGTGATGNQVKGNLIGTNAAGNGAVGNSFSGIDVEGSSNTIGGAAAGEGNIIASNGMKGILVRTTGFSNKISGNSIFSNGELGIDHGGSGVTPNDTGDGDISGSNPLQNFPVITSVTGGGGNTTISGSLNSTAGTNFTLEFFANTAADPSGFGEGQTYLGSTNVTTNASGNASFTVVIPTAIASLQYVTATATDPANNTSEFSADFQFIGNTPPVVDLNGADGGGVNFTAAFVEDAGPKNITDTDAAITDAENTSLASLTLVVSANPDGADESLTVAGVAFPLNANQTSTATVGGTTFQIAYVAATRTVTVTRNGGGNAPIGDFQTLLRGVTYNNTDNTPTITNRTIAITANDGVADSSVATATITVTAVNDVPVAQAGSVTTNEDTAYTFAVGDFRFTDVEGDGLASITISSLSLAGGDTLKLGGTDVTVNQTILAANIANLVYAPAANANGAGRSTFSFKVNDAGSGTVAASLTINVTAVNDAPVANAGSVMTNEDTAYTFAAGDFGFTDVEGNSLGSITISSLSLAAGDTLKLGGTDVTVNQTITAANIATLVYTPAANANGSGRSTFNFKVNDADAGTVAATLTMNVTAVNDAPVANDDFYSMNEDDTLSGSLPTMSVGGILFNNNAFVDTVLAISGTVTPFNAATVSAALIGPNLVGVAELGNNSGAGSVLVGFTDNFVINGPGADLAFFEEGTPSVLEHFRVALTMGGLGSGVIVLVSDTGINNALGNRIHVGLLDLSDLGIAEGATIGQIAVTTHAGVIGGSDLAVVGALHVSAGVLSNDSNVEGDPLTAVLVTGPTNGSLTLNGDGSFNYTPAANFNGTDSFTYRAVDSLSGVSNTATVNITVNPVNDVPVAQAGSVTTNEDTAYTFAANDFGFTDVEGDGLASITISSLGLASGDTLKLSGTDVTVNQTILTANIANLVYSPAANANGSGRSTFNFRVNDADSGTMAATLTIHVTAVNDLPVANASSVTTNEDTPRTFAVSDFLFTDVESDGLVSVTVSGLTLAVGDTLTVDQGSGAVTVTNGMTITAAQIASLIYTPAANANGSGRSTFSFQVNDADSGTVAASLTINVTAVNDAPVANAGSVTTNEDTAYTFAAGDFGFTDVEGDGLASITISSLSLASGDTLKLSGTDVTVNQTILAANIMNLVYAPAANANGAGRSTFSFKVNDAGSGTVTATLTINVTAVNDAPVANAGSVMTNEDTAYTFTVGDFGFTDVESDSLLSITISGLSLASGDTLTVNQGSGAVTVTNGMTILAADLANLMYTPAANANGSGRSTFDFQVNDADSGTVAATLMIHVTAVNDVPVANASSVTTNEDTAYTFAVGDFGFTDVEGNSLASITISSLSLASGDTLKLSGTDVTVNQTILAANIANLVYTPATNANGLGRSAFNFKVNDADSGTVAATLTIAVTAVSDAPTVSNAGHVTVDEGQTAINSGTWGDVDAGDDVTLNASVGLVTKNANGTWSWSFGTNDGPAQSQTVTITADDGTTTTETTFELTVRNVAPEATSNNYTTTQAVSVSGNVLTDGIADSDPAGALDPLTVSAVNGVAASVGQAIPTANGTLTVNANGSFTYQPATTFSGTESFTYTISDGDGGSDTATVTIVVTPAASDSILTVTDTCCDGGTALLITGSSANDTIVVEPGATSSTLKVTVNGVSATVAKPSGRIIVTGGAGNDNIQIAGAITNSVWLYGDAGDDRLNAGNVNPGGNLLFGGDGNDDLLGGSGRDILVGGQGADKITGNASDDILIAGLTAYDSRSSAAHEEFWCSVLEEWTDATSSFATRVNKLRTGTGTTGVNLLPNIVDDNSIDEIDQLQGSSGNDWFIFKSGEDKVVGQIEAAN